MFDNMISNMNFFTKNQSFVEKILEYKEANSFNDGNRFENENILLVHFRK